MTPATPGQAAYEIPEEVIKATAEAIGTSMILRKSPREIATAALRAASAAQQPKPAPGGEVRTCYCGTTATVIPGVFPHADCDGSVLVQPAPELPVTTPAVTRPAWGDVIVLAVGEDFPADRAKELQDTLAALNQGVAVVTVRGIEALRTWKPQPAPELAASPKIGELTIATCEIDGHAPHAARITVDYGLQVTSFCLPPEHGEFLGDALASGKLPAGTARKLKIAMAALREIDQDGDDYSARATAEEALADIAEVPS